MKKKSINTPDYVPEELKKSLKLQKKIQKTSQVHNTKNKDFNSTMDPLKQIPALPDFRQSGIQLAYNECTSGLGAILKKMKNPVLDELSKKAHGSIPQVDTKIMDPLKQMPTLTDFQQLGKQFAYNLGTSGLGAIPGKMKYSVLDELSERFKRATTQLMKWQSEPSSFVKWSSAIFNTPLQQILSDLNITLKPEEQLKEKAYLQSLYECNWFPYAGCLAGKTLFNAVNKIIETSRGNSRRKTTRFDKVILSYYTSQKVKKIKSNWQKTNLEPHIKRMLGHAVKAHMRGEYALTTSCLAVMWEGLIKKKISESKPESKEKKKIFEDLVANNGYAKILADYYNDLIISSCHGIDDDKDGVPNRHGIAHSWHKKYPNKKASLNAILLTDFIIGLDPLQPLSA